MYNITEITKKLRFEKIHPPRLKEMERLKGKYRLWKKLNPSGVNCTHCIFRHAKNCWDANKYYDYLLSEGYYCMAFLRKGNYLK